MGNLFLVPLLALGAAMLSKVDLAAENGDDSLAGWFVKPVLGRLVQKRGMGAFSLIGSPKEVIRGILPL